MNDAISITGGINDATYHNDDIIMLDVVFAQWLVSCVPVYFRYIQRRPGDLSLQCDHADQSHHSSVTMQTRAITAV